MTKRALLVEVCGVDGSGKSTATQYAADILSSRIPVATHRPLVGDDEFVKSLRIALRRCNGGSWVRNDKRIDFLSGYYSHVLAVNTVTRIEPDLAEGTLVLCDRYINSHIINQTIFGGEESEFAGLFATLPKPDCVVLIDVPTDVALERLRLRKGPQGVGDNLEFIEKSRELLHLRMKTIPHAHTVNGTFSQTEVGSALASIITDCLNDLEVD